MSFRNTITTRLPALASRDFMIFWVGQFISLIGTWMQNTTQPYLAYRISGRPIDLGIIGFAAALPTLLLALPGGVIVERLNKRNTVIAMQAVMLVQAFALAWLALSGVIQIWHIVALSFLLGCASTIEITARQAMLIELVGKEALPNAIAMQSTIFQAARVLGPSLAAPFLILLQGRGEGWAFLANGVSYFFIIISLFFVRTPFRSPPPPAADRNLWKEFLEGWDFIGRTRVVLLIISISAVIGFLGYPLLQQFPVLARQVLAQANDTEAAIGARTSALYTAQGIGALIAALLLALTNPRRKVWQLSGGLFVFISAVFLLAFTRSLPPAFALIMFIGWGSVTCLAMMNIVIQLLVPDNLRGRVFSTYLWALQGVAPFGSLFTGWMVQSWNLPVATMWCGIAMLVTVGLIHIFSPAIRRL